MEEDTKLYILLEKEGDFLMKDICNRIQELVDKYNSYSQMENGEKDAISAVQDIVLSCIGEYRPIEYARVMMILLLALEKRNNSRFVWLSGSRIYFNSNDLEICRELVIHSIKEAGAGTVKNTNKEFIPLSKEDEEQNIADILGMIADELREWTCLDDEKYSELLSDFAEPLEQWRNLKVPKTLHEESYGLMHSIVELCFKHKAYHTALRLSALLYISDTSKNLENLPNTMLLMGKIMNELGFADIARCCFQFADEDTKSQCWQDGDAKYKTVMTQATKLEITEEVHNRQCQIDEKINKGELKVYSEEEVDQYYAGELEIEFVDSKVVQKNRKKQGEKAIKLYEKSANATPEERLQAIDAAFAVFTEAPEVYPEAAYLYFKKGNIYLDKGDFETAYDCFKKAYNCKDGKRNGMVLLGLAIVLSQMGRMKESTTYLFRTYILCGKDFVIDKVGEEPWKMVEAYLQDK